MKWDSKLGFQQMDLLSSQKKPFFFMVDFDVETVELFDENELSVSGLLIDFQNIKLGDFKHEEKDFKFKASFESLESYKKGFDIVQENLRLGNSYLANYTRKTPIETNLGLEEIFAVSKAKYKVCYPNRFVFFSPETFVEIKDERIYTHPMKGTIDASIPDAETLLKNDEKEKAEHYTVVDLLRNDLSTIANKVQVDYFQRIDVLKTHDKTLLAMSSEISGDIKPGFQGKIGSVLEKLLPAGSILGAPKPKTKQIIEQAETEKRGWYTGICGYFDGENLDSCVMIRFIEKEGNQLYFRSGGGITHQSQLESEYKEMKNKIYVPIF